MSLKDIVPPNELWAYARAIEDEYASEARRIMERLGVPDQPRRGVTNAFHSTQPDPLSFSEAEVKAAASEIAARLRKRNGEPQP